MKINPNPWTHFWRTQPGHACIASDGENYSAAISCYWRSLIETANASKILDICTGNGAVPLMLKRAAQELKRDVSVVGIDSADIHPENNTELSAFSSVELLGGVDVRKLPFDDGTFDTVTGQYALEYCEFSDALSEIARVLQLGGYASFLMHDSDGKSVSAAKESIDFIEKQGRDWQYLDKVKSYIIAMCDYRSNGGSARHQVMKTSEKDMMEAFYRVSDYIKINETSPMAFNLTDVIRHMLQHHAAFTEAQMLSKVEELRNSVEMHKERLSLCISAAIDEIRQKQLENIAAENGLQLKTINKLSNENDDILAVSNTFIKVSV